MKLSSGPGEQVKGNPLPIVNRCGYPLHLQGIILPQGRLTLPTTPSNDEGKIQRGMKFSEKYELLETLTTGAVETFVAQDKVRGERVLVHIVECPTQKPDQTTAEWVLGAFRNQAPEPPGSVLETGKYSGPKYGYVVIKTTDETAVKRWVRQYELQADETKETNVETQRTGIPAGAGPTAVSPIVVKESPPPSVSMTQVFRDFDSLGKSKGPEATAADLPARKPAPPIKLPGESGVHAANPWDVPSAKPSSLPDEPPFPASAAPPKPAAPDMASSVSKQSGKPGEFTSFFQGPFQGDKPAEMPAFSSQPIEAPKKTVGEFTAIFGGTTPPAAGSPISSNGSEPSFTSIFNDMKIAPQPASNAAPAVQGGVVPGPVQPLPSASPANASLPDPVFVAPTPIVTSTPAAPLIPDSPNSPVEIPSRPRSGSLPGNDATGAFMRPAAEPMQAPAETPRGPSPYTQIISRPKMESPEASSGSAATAGGGHAGPSTPKIPAAGLPPVPKMPPVPKVAPPPVPKLKAPPAPKMPKIDAPAPPPVSMWPLIITLTVLFFLAVLLVLYFVLKH